MLAIDHPHMKKLVYIFSLLLILSACYQTYDKEKVPEPDNLIGEDKIVLILADIEITESVLRDKQNQGHEIDGQEEIYYATIFKTYEVSREEFESSMSYYKQDMKRMDKIYEAVVTRLSVLESEVEHE
jgi:hypothetical protein